MPTTKTDPNPIVVIAAVRKEVELLLTALHCLPEPPRTFPTWGGGEGKVLIVLSGLGKANAAAATAAAIERYAPSIILNVGCAGAFAGSGLGIGDVAVATEEIAADEGVLTLNGWLPLDEIGFPVAVVEGVRYFNRIPLSQNLVRAAVAAGADRELAIAAGRFVTVSTCSGTAARGAEIKQRYSPLCESMEGAAIAQTALRYGVECAEIRGVSNMVEDRDLSRWNISLAVDRAQQGVLALLHTLGAA